MEKQNKKRPYLVTHKGDHGSHQVIVMAFNKAQAIRHVADKMFDAKPATGTEVVKLMQGGIGIEIAGGGEQLTFGNVVDATADRTEEGGE